MTTQIAQAWPSQYFDAVALSSGTVCPNGAGSGLLITASVSGTANLTLLSGTIIPLDFPAGSSVWQFQVTEVVVNTGTVTSMYNLIGAG